MLLSCSFGTKLAYSWHARPQLTGLRLRRKQPDVVSAAHALKLLKKQFAPAWLDKLPNLFGLGDLAIDAATSMEGLIADFLQTPLVWKLTTLESSLVKMRD